VLILPRCLPFPSPKVHANKPELSRNPAKPTLHMPPTTPAFVRSPETAARQATGTPAKRRATLHFESAKNRYGSFADADAANHDCNRGPVLDKRK
jgi:hypothetical protein